MTPPLADIDHVHVFVANQNAAANWYRDVLGLCVVEELRQWSAGAGPLTIANATGTIHLALFERAPEKCRSTIALSTSAGDFLAWREHLANVFNHKVDAVDHAVSWSLYFSDPDGNPFEITSYEHTAISSALRRADGRLAQ